MATLRVTRLLAWLVVLFPALVSALDLTCTGGDTVCLVAALGKANAAQERTSLVLGGDTFTLTTIDNSPLNDGPNGLPIITGTLLIQGQGASATRLRRDPQAPLFRLLQIAPGAHVVLRNLTLEGGEVDANLLHRGGGISNLGSLRLVEVVLHGHSAWLGGCVDNWGPLEIVRSALTECFADFLGGGLALVRGPVLIRGTLIADNISESAAGIIVDPGAQDVFIVQSTFTGQVATLNTGAHLGGEGTVQIVQTALVDGLAGVRGGCLNWSGGHLTMQQSSCTANAAVVFGGGLFVENGEVHLDRTVTTHNQAGLAGLPGAGGGIFNAGGTVRLRRSLLTQNQAATGPDCLGPVHVTQSLIGDPTGCTVQRGE
jgi:hypothetical protein